MSRHLVTGAGGFIGHHLIKYLKSKNHFVIGIDIKHPEFEPTRADLFELFDLRERKKEWEALFSDVDSVWALAADMGGMGYISRNHAMIMQGNVRININTLEAARRAKVKHYLYTSSACVYPEYLQMKSDVKPLSESEAYPAQPQDGYGWEKLYTEKLCTYYGQEYGLDVRIVRFHNIYGPLGAWRGGREKAPAALCRKVAEAVLKGRESIEIWGDGEQTRSFCYIDDCIKGLQLIMNSGYQEPINLGRDEMVSINDLADLIMNVAGTSLTKIHIEGPQGVRGRNSDNALARQILKWCPQIDLRQGLMATYQWIFDQISKGANENV